jgi:hypothetical protein
MASRAPRERIRVLSQIGERLLPSALNDEPRHREEQDGAHADDILLKHER